MEQIIPSIMGISYIIKNTQGGFQGVTKSLGAGYSEKQGTKEIEKYENILVTA